jgi:hypothetical protein
MMLSSKANARQTPMTAIIAACLKPAGAEAAARVA